MTLVLLLVMSNYYGSKNPA